MLHLAWVSLPTAHKCEILETTLNGKKATQRRRRLPPPPLPAGVWNQLHCADGLLKEIVFTPLNYIQPFKIQIYLFSSGMSDMHFYPIYIY